MLTFRATNRFTSRGKSLPLTCGRFRRATTLRRSAAGRAVVYAAFARLAIVALLQPVAA